MDRVLVMEHHDRAYHAWRDCGVKERVLIHIDSHHDTWWIPEERPTTAANFVCRALRENQVRELIWVVPDPAWESAESRRPLVRHLKKLGKMYPQASHTIRIDSEQISTVILRRPLRICPLKYLPSIRENVLLDIDVDFFIIPRVAFGRRDTHGAFPWCWPDELAARLGQCNIRADLITIAYSVEGGYTPLKWKYLGDELALRLGQSSPCQRTIRGMALVREGSLAARLGDPAAAQRIYEESADLLPGSAAPYYHLAHLCLETGRQERAQELYQRALDRDPSYRTAYNSFGLWHDWARHYEAAEREHQRMLALDPKDAYALFGLGRHAARRKSWREAERWLRKALDSNGSLVDAHRVLGEALEKQGRYHEAIEAYTRSLRLVLAGHRPLGAALATYSEYDHPADPGHWRVHARLARLFERIGAGPEAIRSYRMAIAGGCGGVIARSRLARLYLRRKQWRNFGNEAWEAGVSSPRGLWAAGRRFYYRLTKRYA